MNRAIRGSVYARARERKGGSANYGCFKYGEADPHARKVRTNEARSSLKWKR